MNTALPSDDPVVALVAEKRRLIAMVKRSRTDEEADLALDKQVKVDRAIIQAKPITLAGALAGLKAAEYEFETFLDEDSDDGHRIIIAAIKGAIAVLEREVAKA